MPIPGFYQVDFSAARKNLVRQALSRLLDQHADKPLLRRFVATLLLEVQDLYDALIDLQEGRTLYAAEDENLNALGRIVGEPRTPYQYDDSHWLFADRTAQSPDSAAAWCVNAPFAAFLPVDDSQYKMNILSRIIKNHTLAASVPELERLTRLLTGQYISYDKTGPMQVSVLAPANLSATALNLLSRAQSSRRADDVFQLPYPATLWFDGVMTYVPDAFFCADRGEESSQQCDRARCAVKTSYQIGVNHAD